MQYTYVSLFSSGGLGCYGLSQSGFQCLVTAELKPKRLEIQKRNRKCQSLEDYICGDLTDENTYCSVLQRIQHYVDLSTPGSVDVLVATPPCQGMSSSNYKKKNEVERNSLVVRAIQGVKDIRPKAFFFENVRAFMNTICVDSEENHLEIGAYLHRELSDEYHIFHRVINLKDYGCPSSRPRTIVVGTRKELTSINPLCLFPLRKGLQTVRGVIGDLPSLDEMGEISLADELHFFRKYPVYQRAWLRDLEEGKSALQNPEESRPYKLAKDGTRSPYASTHINNKFTRLYWDKPGKCIATRSDQMHSQDTLHPQDDRVLSIRELMRLMTVPDSFVWFSDEERAEIVRLRECIEQKKAEATTQEDDEKGVELLQNTINEYMTAVRTLLKQYELVIRQLLGEAVPTFLFAEMGRNFVELVSFQHWKNAYQPFQGTAEQIDTQVQAFILDPRYSVYQKSYVIEYNQDPKKHGKYYTPQHVVYNLLRPCILSPKQIKSTVRILEPTVGAGNFLRQTLAMFGHCEHIELTLCDLDAKTLAYTQQLVAQYLAVPNAEYHFLHQDIMDASFDNPFDFAIANPPYGSVTGKVLQRYRAGTTHCDTTQNIFTFVLERIVEYANQILLVLPKTFIMSPEYNSLRRWMENEYQIVEIHDYGVKAFPEVYVEILSIYFAKATIEQTKIVDHIHSETLHQPSGYIFHDQHWLLYRDEFFDDYIQNIQLDVLSMYRDRAIAKKDVYQSDVLPDDPEATWVVKSKNVLDDGTIQPKSGYDVYLDNPEDFDVSQYCHERQPFFVTFTYNIRMGYVPKNSLVNGSLALIFPKEEYQAQFQIIDYLYFSSEEFRRYYRVVKNRAKFTVNIDANSIYYLGIHKNFTHSALMNRVLLECVRQTTMFEEMFLNALTLDELQPSLCGENTQRYIELVGYSSVEKFQHVIRRIQSSTDSTIRKHHEQSFKRRGEWRKVLYETKAIELIVHYDALGFPIFLPDNGLLYDMSTEELESEQIDALFLMELESNPRQKRALLRQLKRFAFSDEGIQFVLENPKDSKVVQWHRHQEGDRVQLILSVMDQVV